MTALTLTWPAALLGLVAICAAVVGCLASYRAGIAAGAASQRDIDRADDHGDVAHLHASLADLRAALERAEHARAGGDGRIEAQLAAMAAEHREIARATSSLNAALRNPGVRGRWGEVQLSRIVEAAGLMPGVVFRTQAGSDGGRKRPDMVIDLGLGRRVVIDAKVPLSALIEAHDRNGDIDDADLAAHAAAVRARIADLAGKDYRSTLPTAADFVVLFLPADEILSAALRADASLLDIAADSDVVLATPSTLMALLRVIAVSWREEQAEAHTAELLTLATDAVNRVGLLSRHLQNLGVKLDAAVTSYNAVVGSWQSRMRPVARRLADFGGEYDAIGELTALDTDVRRPDPLSDTA